MGVCDSILKFLVFVFNILFFVVGCGIIGLGCYMYFEMKDYLSFLGDTGFVDATIGFIVVGVILTVVSFFGICAVCTDNSCMFKGFGCLMMLVVIAEFGIAIAILILKVDAEEAISSAMNDSLDDYNVKTEVTNSWDSMQKELKCCGVDTYTDWKNTTFNNPDNTTKYGNDVPDSCCIDGPTQDCGKDQLDPNTHKNGTIYEKGCLKTFEDYIEDNAYIVGGAGAGLGVLQILVLVGSFCLAKRDNYYA